MNLLIILAALGFLMLAAYRGYSVILFAPLAAMGAVLLTDPAEVAPMFTGLFMDKMAGFFKLYFPIFLLGAVFGKTMELSGFAKSIASAIIELLGRQRSVLSIVIVSALLTYGGVSLFVAVFAVYPFAAELFRQSGIPKRLIPATIALGAFSFTMDSFPGTPQIQNVIPAAFFKTDIYAAPWLGILGGLFTLLAGLLFLEWRVRVAAANEEGYGDVLLNEPAAFEHDRLPSPWLAMLPLLVVAVANKILTGAIPRLYGESHAFIPAVVGTSEPVVQDVAKISAIWSIEAALILGILTVMLLAWRHLFKKLSEGTKPAIAGALLAATNTASEYGFGAVIAALPGFLIVSDALRWIPNPLVNEAVTVTTLAGITGSASGGLSIALAAMSETFIANAEAAGIPLEVFHRVASMASGGMDTLPHNGAVITLLAVSGLTHRQAYGNIFGITLIKTLAVFVVIVIYQWTGLV
ncbi:Citrate transporter [Rosistilla carotiformis]|uniref:Citrate transporter n=1 Tax=Rosistilla carotiformis TaxID=2528017 RepID=A0A518K0H3_9BACT|nr:GntP family permease [Rosistilla carotiformis]QDV71306.1 Citrate transporter [Rosistilla carotiformis]